MDFFSNLYNAGKTLLSSAYKSVSNTLSGSSPYTASISNAAPNIGINQSNASYTPVNYTPNIISYASTNYGPVGYDPSGRAYQTSSNGNYVDVSNVVSSYRNASVPSLGSGPMSVSSPTTTLGSGPMSSQGYSGGYSSENYSSTPAYATGYGDIFSDTAPTPPPSVASVGNSGTPSVPLGSSYKGYTNLGSSVSTTNPVNYGTATTGTPEEEQKKKEAVMALLNKGITDPNVIAGLLNSFQFGRTNTPIGFTPEGVSKMVSDFNVNSPGAVVNVPEEQKVAQLKSLLNQTSAYKTTLEQTWAEAQAKGRQNVQIPLFPIIDTPEQKKAIDEQPDLQAQMDKWRIDNGIPELNKAKIQAITDLQTAETERQSQLKAIDDDTEAPQGLKDRRKQAVDLFYQNKVKTFNNQLQIINAQLDQANQELDRVFKIKQIESSQNNTNADNYRQMLTLSNGNIDDATLAAWSKNTGIPVSTWTQMRDAVKTGDATKLAQAEQRLTNANSSLDIANQRLALAQENASGSDSSIIADFGKALADRSKLDAAGTREQFIRQLVAQFPKISASSISDYVYGTYPDGYKK
jgi:hypothetical protein